MGGGLCEGEGRGDGGDGEVAAAREYEDRGTGHRISVCRHCKAGHVTIDKLIT